MLSKAPLMSASTTHFFRLLGRAEDVDLRDGIVAAAPRSEPVAAALEPGLPLRLQGVLDPSPGGSGPITVGMPSGRSLPLDFRNVHPPHGLRPPGLVGGQMVHQPPLAAGVFTTSLSTPGVSLPALTCVTLLTLMRMLE